MAHAGNTSRAIESRPESKRRPHTSNLSRGGSEGEQAAPGRVVEEHLCSSTNTSSAESELDGDVPDADDARGGRQRRDGRDDASLRSGSSRLPPHECRVSRRRVTDRHRRSAVLCCGGSSRSRVGFDAPPPVSHAWCMNGHARPVAPLSRSCGSSENSSGPCGMRISGDRCNGELSRYQCVVYSGRTA